MRELCRLFTLRYLRANRFRALLGLAAVALGVALFVSSDVTTKSVRASMRETLERLAGRAEWRVTRGPSFGVEEALLPRIRAIPGAVAAPVIQASVTLRRPRGGMLIVLGIDFWEDSLLRLYRVHGAGPRLSLGDLAAGAFLTNGLMVTRSFAERYHLHPGDPVQLNTRRGVRALRITALLEDDGPARVLGGRFAVMDLHAAQALFGRPGVIDRIEVAGVSREQLERACPKGTVIAPAARASTVTEDALARIDSLVVISLIALLVGLFIIYNSVQISVLERLKQIGTLRALGASRRQILLVLLLEWVMVGLCGSTIGIGLGWALARALMSATSRALSPVLLLIDFHHVELTPSTAVAALLLGVGTTLAATLIPAAGVARTPPLELLRPYRYRRVHRHRVAFGIGGVVSVLGLATMGTIPVSRTAGLAATAFVFLGLALMLPQVLLQCGRWGRRLGLRVLRLEGYLAADNLIQFPQRTALTAVTLGGALAMMVATAALTDGFRTATSEWRSETFPFDLAIMGTEMTSSIFADQPVPRSLLPRTRRVPGVALAYGVRKLFAGYRGAEIMVIGLELEPFLQMQRRRGPRGWVRQMVESGEKTRLRAGDGVYVSENFASLFGVRAGDRIELSTPAGLHPFHVLRAIRDYSWPRGLVLMDLDLMGRLWRDDGLSYIDLSLAAGASVESVRAAVAGELGELHTLFVYDHEEIRRVSDGVLRQTLAVANVQVLIAIVIGFLGIVNSLLINVLQRTREIGLMRAIGMTRSQVARTVVLEGVFIAAIGGVIGLAAGLAGGWLPLRLFTFAVTGYLYPLVVPWAHAGMALAVALVIGLVGSLIPARRAARLPVLDAIGYE